jgi:hypothetical protein
MQGEVDEEGCHADALGLGLSIEWGTLTVAWPGNRWGIWTSRNLITEAQGCFNAPASRRIDDSLILFGLPFREDDCSRRFHGHRVLSPAA